MAELNLDNFNKILSEALNKKDLEPCGRCIHDEESADIVGSSCYLCKRNPTDNRIDWFEEEGK